MRYRVHVSRLPSGQFQATCLDPNASARGGSVESALDALRGEIRYVIEMCPCTAVTEAFVELEVVSRPRGT